jgi:hypothetical protein
MSTPGPVRHLKKVVWQMPIAKPSATFHVTDCHHRSIHNAAAEVGVTVHIRRVKDKLHVWRLK